MEISKRHRKYIDQLNQGAIKLRELREADEIEEYGKLHCKLHESYLRVMGWSRTIDRSDRISGVFYDTLLGENNLFREGGEMTRAVGDSYQKYIKAMQRHSNN